METINQNNLHKKLSSKSFQFQYRHLINIINPKYLTVFAYYLILIAYVFGFKDIFVYILPMIWTNTLLGNWLALFYIDEMIHGINNDSNNESNNESNIKIIHPQKREVVRWVVILLHLIPTLILTKIGLSYYKANNFPILESLTTIIIILILYTIISPKKVYGNIPYSLIIALYLPVAILSMHFIISSKRIK